ncbi:lipoprotein [Terribacillus saccharophilus]
MKRLLSLILLVVILAGCSIEIEEADERKDGFSFERVNGKEEKDSGR